MTQQLDRIEVLLLEVKRLLTRKGCLRCEGHGVIRNYINVAGSYEKSNCPDCKGTGKDHD